VESSDLSPVQATRKGGAQTPYSTQEKHAILDVFFTKLWCKASEKKRSFKELFEELAGKLSSRSADFPGRSFNPVDKGGAALQRLVKGEMFSMLRDYFDKLEAFLRDNKEPVRVV